jgi:hypothetical protein
MLLAILARLNLPPSARAGDLIPRPLTRLSQSSLFTGSRTEPSLASELKKEILSADRIDILMSFIKWSGLRIIADELKAFTDRPASRLRVITTTYIGATDIQCIEFRPSLDAKQPLFFITLYKSEKDYSPMTMYEDYAISDTLFHWQSQSTTSDTSPTGQRYIHHRKTGNRILLFVREHKQENDFTAPYDFLGPANYIKHESSRPMNITWELGNPMPAHLWKETGKLAVGE